MADLNLTQAEADALLAIEKHRVDDQEWEYPITGGKLSVPLISVDRREDFVLDLSRNRITLEKHKFQTRGRQVVVLVRLDVGGSPHRNPDDEEISCPHLHIYREDYGDKWAQPVPQERFADLTDPQAMLNDFMRFCNVTQQPCFFWGLFR